MKCIYIGDDDKRQYHTLLHLFFSNLLQSSSILFCVFGRVTRLIMYSYLLYHVWDGATGFSRLWASWGNTASKLSVRCKHFVGVLDL